MTWLLYSPQISESYIIQVISLDTYIHHQALEHSRLMSVVSTYTSHDVCMNYASTFNTHTSQSISWLVYPWYMNNTDLPVDDMILDWWWLKSIQCTCWCSAELTDSSHIFQCIDMWHGHGCSGTCLVLRPNQQRRCVHFHPNWQSGSNLGRLDKILNGWSKKLVRPLCHHIS